MLSEIPILLEEHFRTLWEALANGIDIDYDGTRPTSTAPFVRMEIIPGASSNIGLNEAPTRFGTVAIMIFTPENEGRGNAWILADSVKNIFENKRVSDIRMYETSVYDRGKIEGELVHVFEASTTYEVEK